MRRILASFLFLIIMTSQFLSGEVYYIDATNGDDNNPGTSQSNPWQTIARVNGNSFDPGDTILFKRGEIWYEMLDVSWSGEEGNPITFGAYGTGSKPIISGASQENPTTQIRPYAIRVYSQRHLIFKNLECQYGWADGLRTNGRPGDHCHDIEIKNCVSHHNSIHGYKAAIDEGGERVMTYRITYTDCVAYENGYHGFQASNGSGDISFIKCTAHDNSQDPEWEGAGFRFGETAVGLIRSCRSYNNFYGIRVASWTYPVYGITIEDCDVHDNRDYGILIFGPVGWVYESITVRRNKAYDNGNFGIIAGGANVLIQDGLCAYNIAYGNSGGGISWQAYGPAGGDSEIYNNVIANNSGAGLEIGSDVGIKVKNNIFYQNSTQLKVDSGTFDHNLYYPNVSFARKGPNDISANPLFKRAIKHNYHLRATSPCIDAGTFVGLTEDHDRKSVPYGDEVDIGAYEYIGDYPDVDINATPTFGEAPLTVNFTGNASGGVPPYTYRWDFGDGQSSTEQNPTHTYDEYGGYTVTLKVTDKQKNQGSDSIFIYVSAPAPTPSPYLSCSPQTLSFGASIVDAALPDQYLRIINAGGEMLTWNIEDDAGWLSSSPSSGTNRGKVTISVNASGLPIGSYNATITVSSPEAYNSPQYVSVNLKVSESENEALSFGEFNTPIDGLTVSGIVPLSGWALDDIEVTRVEIKRNSDPEDPAEAIDSDGLVYIGDAVFVEEARPDIEIMYPDYPLNSRAGWGYGLLTNSLPNRGNGLFTIYAFAHNRSGNKVEIGKKIIVCDNTNRSKPFGTIETPQQGENIIGNSYTNFGWVLTPFPKTIPKDGSTIWVWVDGVQIGNATYNQYREDIASQYPEYNNAQGAEAYYHLDTSQLGNGAHTIVWSAMDDWDEVDGIGMSYFFTESIEIENVQHQPSKPRSNNQEKESEKLQISVAETRKGYSLEVINGQKMKRISESQLGNFKRRKVFRLRADDKQTINNKDILRITIEEMEPVRITFGGSFKENVQYIGWGANRERTLPVGSTLNPEKGIFSWIPTPGFIRRYILYFAIKNGSYMSKPLRVLVNVIPKSHY